MKSILLLTSLLLSLSANAAHTVGGFDFTYNVGEVVGYHAYGLAVQVGLVSSPPVGTVQLGNWYVWDLGEVSGIGSVTCPAPLSIRGAVQSAKGILFFANTVDLGGQAFTHPVADVEEFLPKWYGGDFSVEVLNPYLSLYFGAPFSPFTWDLSPYLW